MKLLLAYLIALTTFMSCSNSSRSEANLSNIQTDQNSLVKANIIGVWAFNEEDNALFEITDDSIYYVEHMDAPVTYEVKSDTLFIFYEGLTTKNKVVKLDNDSLVFKTEIGVINRLYKRK